MHRITYGRYRFIAIALAVSLVLSGCAAVMPSGGDAAGASDGMTRPDVEDLEHEPSDPQSWYLFGNSLAEQDQLRAAQRAYEQALALDPEFAPARYNLGLVHLQLGWRAVIGATPDLPESDRAALAAARYLQCVAEILKGNPEPDACRSPETRENQDD